MNTLKEKLLNCLNKEGADIVRFGNADRFRDPVVRKLFPDAKTVIGIAFRQLRGARRGIEEGSTYYQYTTNAVETLDEIIIPMALMRACGVIEDEGFEALPQRQNLLIMSNDEGTHPEVDYHEIYRNKKEENQLDFKTCAVDAGLGEIGLSGSLLTDEFGPFQRYAFILTDAPFDPDPVITPHLCDRCGKCIKGCPGRAISDSGDIDSWQCSVYYNGANRSKNPFMPPEAFADDPDRLAIISGEARLSPERAKEIIDQLIYYPPMKHALRASICGRACDTECYIHLEEKGVLTKKFKTPFRKRPEWVLSIEDEKENME